MASRHLTEKERGLLVDGLQVAIDAYDSAIKAIETLPGHARMCAQFEEQIRLAGALMEEIEQCDAMSIFDEAKPRDPASMGGA